MIANLGHCLYFSHLLSFPNHCTGCDDVLSNEPCSDVLPTHSANELFMNAHHHRRRYTQTYLALYPSCFLNNLKDGLWARAPLLVE